MTSSTASPSPSRSRLEDGRTALTTVSRDRRRSPRPGVSAVQTVSGPRAVSCSGLRRWSRCTGARAPLVIEPARDLEERTDLGEILAETRKVRERIAVDAPRSNALERAAEI